MFHVVLSDEARRFFEESPGTLQKRLERCFNQLAREPIRHPNIKPLKGILKGRYRYRVGDYRVIYTVDHAAQVIAISLIAHRREVYDG